MISDWMFWLLGLELAGIIALQIIRPFCFHTAIGKAKEVAIYEGLPHQLFEAALLQAELREKSHIVLADFPFYAEPLPIDPEDVARLTLLFQEEQSIIPWGGERRCGGFHPDFCVEWRVNQKTYRILICFGCGECLLSTPYYTGRNDIGPGYGTALYDILTPYQKNRPNIWLTREERNQLTQQWKKL